MALQAKHVDVAEFEQVRVRRTVSDVARRAAVDFHCSVLEDEGAVLLNVALETNGVLRGGGSHLLRGDGAVRVMTVGTLHETFVDAMVEGHSELRLLLQMARVAKLGLRLREQRLLRLRMMRRVAGKAAHIGLAVQGIRGVHVFSGRGVAGEAAIVDLLRGMTGKDENFRFVAGTGNMGRPGAVTALAALT